MDAALDRLVLGVGELDSKAKDWDRREEYARGEQDLPYAPEGVNEEYLQLREMSVANWLDLAMRTPIQRLRVDGFKAGPGREQDTAFWSDVWQGNKLDARQNQVYWDMMVHDQGLLGVWPNAAERSRPVVRPESGRRVHLEHDAEDPSRIAWAVKRFTIRERQPTTLVLPAGLTVTTSREVGIVYDDREWVRFERANGSGTWKFVKEGKHPLGDVPFSPYSVNADASTGKLYPSIVPLMPQQDAINTIRFHTLLALQFSAYRQRVFVGYDPRVKDSQGNPVWRKNADGTTLLDAQGQPIPVVSSPGRIGVDRALVFPGHDTKVFDLPESNLDNYIKVLGEFLTQFFATGQIPPQYLLSRMANLSGDALAGAESTLAALVQDLKVAAGEAHEHTKVLADRARGVEVDYAAEALWADAEARSFAQTVDAIVKLVSINFPRRAAYEMIPGATATKVTDWMKQFDDEQGADLAAGLKALESSAPPEPADDDARVGA